MDDQVPNDGTNKELPNDGQSRTKRRPITYQTMDDQEPNDRRLKVPKRWKITNQTMGQTAPNDGRSSTKVPISCFC
ncbi:hypothetical protein BLOT_011562 [Blomia tropicalis]|nr:hypothetical protein BLOT_011562 [Blomia tropicalis]